MSGAADWCPPCRQLRHGDCVGRVDDVECRCPSVLHTTAHFITDGDPYSDPGRSRVCRRCGALVPPAYEELHVEWHGVLDPFGCTRGLDHRWHSSGVTTGWVTRWLHRCKRCGVERESTSEDM